MTRRHLVIATTAVVVAGLAIVAAKVVVPSHSASAERRATDSFLAAWARGDSTQMAALLDTPPPDLGAPVASLRRSAPGTTLSLRETGVKTTGSQATATFHGHFDIAGFGPFDWDGQLGLVETNHRWRVHWSPDVVFPGLVAGQRLMLRATWPTRAPILGADGTPLVSDQPAVSVGLEPDHIKDLDQVKATMSQLLGVDPATVDRALAAPGVQPNFFVPIITLRNDRYDSLRPQLAPVPGIVFQRTHGRFAVNDGLAVHVLGRVGDITADRLTQLGPPYAVGDTVGLSGLELVYETRLAGRPAGDLDITDDKGNVVRMLQTYPGTDPQPVQVTLDPVAQTAAERALEGVTQPAAIVALDAATGQLRAVVSAPTDQEFDRALDGQYPPGSTFKIVTATALLNNGDTVDTASPCPSSLTVGGKTFTNFEGEAATNLALHQAFAASCNTAFIGLAAGLPPNALADAAATFGFGANYKLPLPSAGANFPTPADDAERAAAAIGQGRVTVSPLHLATVAGTVASGQWHAPMLMLQPPDQTSAPASPAPPKLTPSTLDALRTMMTEVVTSGTGRAAAVDGQPIAGKTGTAEFGATTPPSTHAWFAGYRGTLAFAVLVEGGGVGGETAAPIAARFLSGVPQ